MRRWMRVLITVGVVAAVVAAGLWAYLLLRGSSSATRTECTVPAVPGAPVTVQVEGPQTSGAGAAGTAAANASPAPSSTVVDAGDVSLSAVQLQHASTINAVGLASGRPEQARIIAVATAWQESSLRNLTGGDRDSVGLFQQRPSQGWGDPADLNDPVYAATAFYTELEKVQGWQDMSLTAAAQAVQYSAFPDAYAQWEPAATTLVRALSGADPVVLSCATDATAPDVLPVTRDVPAGATDAAVALRTLLAAAYAELGPWQDISISTNGTTATVTPGQRGPEVWAAWSVAHSTGTGLASIQLGDRRYENGSWSTNPESAAPPGQVVLAIVPA